MKCRKIVVMGACLLYLVGIAIVGTGACQQNSGNETTTTTAPAPQGTAPTTSTAPSGDKAKESGKGTDTSSKPGEKKKTYEGC
jgi:hypothetical protein